MRNSYKLAKIFWIAGAILALAGSVSVAGDHHGYGQPVYLMPVGPVAAYAPAPMAYAPAPLAYAPPKHGHSLFHKNRYYAYPVAPYAQPAPYGYAAAPAAAAPATYSVTAYTVQASNYAAAPASSGYTWKLVKNDGNDDIGAAPGTDSNYPTFSDLTTAQNDKIRRLAKDSLSGYSNMSSEKKKNALIDDIKSYYADEADVTLENMTSGANSTARRLASWLINGSSSSNSDDSNDGSTSVKVFLAPAPPLQLFLPVVPVKPGHFHKGY